ncbi:hypothetical protein ACQKOF_07625 [Lysinibacillus sp. NPDC093190]
MSILHTTKYKYEVSREEVTAISTEIKERQERCALGASTHF